MSTPMDAGLLAVPAAEQALLPQGMLRIAKGGVISVC